MELKNYQRKVMDDLNRFLDAFRSTPIVAEAYRKHWENQGVPVNGLDGMKPYTNLLGEVPHVCFKVPTGGGKTFLACNALRPVFDAFPFTRTKVVVWLVPSDAILQQTVKNLSNPDHGYRHKINVDFSNRVEVYAKSQLLAGQNFNPVAVQEQLSILILSYDSFRSKTKEGRKGFQENGNLAQFVRVFGPPDHPIDGADETSLIQIVNQLNPVVIVDESHHAISDLSIEMLRNFNPKFVLDLTATPKSNSNIISFVDAAELKAESMVKLPVIVYNRPGKEDVLYDAITFRNRLEATAINERAATGRYIRPIVLFQAQPRNSEDSTTFEKIKEGLLLAGIPASQIAIKTAEKDELKNVDLLSESTEIRYIITVNALKEGWDCPFAYILATIANKTSVVDVEQIVGRILRQPHTRQCGNPLLNYAYVFTSSSHFSDTVNKVVDGLNKAGFGKWECREVETLPTAPARQPDMPEQGKLSLPDEEAADSGFDPEALRKRLAVAAPETTPADDPIAATALAQGEEYTAAIAATENQSVPMEVRNRMKHYAMRPEFAEQARAMQIPQFHLKQPPSLFSAEDSCLLDKKHLTKGFTLKNKDSEIDFAQLQIDAYAVDITGQGREQQVQRKVLDDAERRRFQEYLNSQPPESRVRHCKGAILQLLSRYDEVESVELKGYVDRIIDNLSSDQLTALETDYTLYARKIREKIDQLLEEHRERNFFEWLNLDKIVVKPSWTFPTQISPLQTSPGIAGSLYSSEGSMNSLETRVADLFSSLPNIIWWHRNLERSGFGINGFLNHYPDFIVCTRNGRILLIESKGEQLRNDDSAAKVRLGKSWANASGQQFRYLMVFDQFPLDMDGAYKFDDFSRMMREL
ncbi:DEAD/DEAH box helicase [Victivallis sp. Marseille-Q1083]|uniref:DEAD/DEAH box helicase n=1 Tax=Victivallis sp. Marseille-Q1083 TaxID=2717288 RepID=UPI00158D322D|nr:DEAD/DEAH box helicase family protein [Victivallis sp. Marseille-Q1083]